MLEAPEWRSPCPTSLAGLPAPPHCTNTRARPAPDALDGAVEGTDAAAAPIGWDCTTEYDGAYVYAFVTGDGRHVKIGFTRNGETGMRDRFRAARAKRALDDLVCAGAVRLPRCTQPDGWAIEEAMRLWLVHRRGFAWHPWQDYLTVPAGVDRACLVTLLEDAYAAVAAWTGALNPRVPGC